jgi:hypothetical protein
MTTTPDLSVRTGREYREISGMDTAIAAMPDEFYIDVEGERTLMIQPFMQMVRKLSEKMATDIGEELHHADWIITTDPAVVQAKGSMHDCDVCRAGVRAALRSLRVYPDKELMVGALYWAGDDKRPEVKV